MTKEIKLAVHSIKIKDGKMYVTLSHPKAVNFPSIIFDAVDYDKIEGEMHTFRAGEKW